MMVYTVKDPYRDTFAFTGQVWGVAGYGLLALVVPLTRPFGRLTLRRYQYAYAAAAVLLMLALASPLGMGQGASTSSCSAWSRSSSSSCCWCSSWWPT